MKKPQLIVAVHNRADEMKAGILVKKKKEGQLNSLMYELFDQMQAVLNGYKLSAVAEIYGIEQYGMRKQLADLWVDMGFDGKFGTIEREKHRSKAFDIVGEALSWLITEEKFSYTTPILAHTMAMAKRRNKNGWRPGDKKPIAIKRVERELKKRKRGRGLADVEGFTHVGVMAFAVESILLGRYSNFMSDQLGIPNTMFNRRVEILWGCLEGTKGYPSPHAVGGDVAVRMSLLDQLSVIQSYEAHHKAVSENEKADAYLEAINRESVASEHDSFETHDEAPIIVEQNQDVGLDAAMQQQLEVLTRQLEEATLKMDKMTYEAVEEQQRNDELANYLDAANKEMKTTLAAIEGAREDNKVLSDALDDARRELRHKTHAQEHAAATHEKATKRIAGLEASNTLLARELNDSESEIQRLKGELKRKNKPRGIINTLLGRHAS